MKKRYTFINIIDISLTAFFLAVIVIFSFLNFEDNTRLDFSAKESITLTLRIKEIPRKYEGTINVKDDVYFEDHTKSLGKIKYVSYSPSSVEFLDKLTNTSAIYKSPDKLDVLLSVESNAALKDGSWVINGVAVSSGAELSLSTSEYAFDATLINIMKNED